MKETCIRPAAADLLTREQVCARLGISLRTLSSLAKTKLPGFRLGGKQKFWEPDAINAYIAACKIVKHDRSTIGCMGGRPGAAV